MTVSHPWIVPDWPAPAKVHAVSTTRQGGVSQPPFHSLNLGAHVGDHPEAVKQNRQLLREQLVLPTEPVWLNQVHGIDALYLDGQVPTSLDADASFTDRPAQVCAVMTADCLPLLLCDRDGKHVAAIHAGWRGLLAGVIENTVQVMGAAPGDLMAWLGPAIGPSAFEVGDEVQQAFVAHDAQAQQAFVAHGQGHWLADIYQLARLRLQALTIDAIYGGTLCTCHEPERFYSYRRDGQTGRMASLIWLE